MFPINKKVRIIDERTNNATNKTLYDFSLFFIDNIPSIILTFAALSAGNILALNVTIDNNSYSIFVADSVSQDDLYDKIGIMFNLTK